MAQHWLEFLLESWPKDWSALLLYANVHHMTGNMKNDKQTLQKAVSLYEKYLDAQSSEDAEALLQYARCLEVLYLFDGKSALSLLVHAQDRNLIFSVKLLICQTKKRLSKLSMYLSAPLTCDPTWWIHGVLMHVSWPRKPTMTHPSSRFATTPSLGSYIVKSSTSKLQPAFYSHVSDVFRCISAYLSSHSDADTLYHWGKLILRKAAYQPENLDLILLAAMKIKTAVETELKLGQFKVIRDTVDALESVTKNSSIEAAALNRVQSWTKVLKNAMDKLHQKAGLKAVRCF
jgi:tetratricopeptide (TPR) repeat protein